MEPLRSGTSAAHKARDLHRAITATVTVGPPWHLKREETNYSKAREDLVSGNMDLLELCI